MKHPAVTVVVATYNRPDVLRVALRSILAQTRQDFKILVIGDGCDDRTQTAIHSLADDRISYVNLPVRFGEQSGPNSIGMALADTEYIALLNHDDVYLPDHLEKALGHLTVSGADIYFSQTAFAYRIKPDPAGGDVLPMFSDVHGKARKLVEGFWDFKIFEPASAWVFTKQLADSIGPWKSSRRLFRPSLQDWGFRIWRAGSKVAFGADISVLKITTQYRAGSTRDAYSHLSTEHAALERWMTATPVAILRDKIGFEVEYEQRIDTRIRRAIERFSKLGVRAIAGDVLRATKFPIKRLFLNRISAKIFCQTGLDSFTLLCRLAGRRRGWIMDQVSVKRVGTNLPKTPSFQAVLEHVKPIIGRPP